MAATLRDCVYGLAVGDALGVPYEFRPRGTFECSGMVGGGSHGQPAGTFSDDTSMTLATCDSIRACGRIDVDDMRARFEDWLFRGAYAVGGEVFDFGGTTSRALRSGAGCAGERDNGNGSLMRIAPLAFAGASDDEVRAVSAITHAHRLSCEACVSYVRVLREVAAGERPSELAPYEGMDVSQRRSGGFVADTYSAALWCLANTSGYAECALAAVNLGDDADTTAAVAGALAGAMYSLDAIPPEWVAALRGKDIIDAALF